MSKQPVSRSSDAEVVEHNDQEKTLAELQVDLDEIEAKLDELEAYSFTVWEAVNDEILSANDGADLEKLNEVLNKATNVYERCKDERD